MDGDGGVYYLCDGTEFHWPSGDRWALNPRNFTVDPSVPSYVSGIVTGDGVVYSTQPVLEFHRGNSAGEPIAGLTYCCAASGKFLVGCDRHFNYLLHCDGGPTVALPGMTRGVNSSGQALVLTHNSSVVQVWTHGRSAFLHNASWPNDGRSINETGGVAGSVVDAVARHPCVWLSPAFSPRILPCVNPHALPEADAVNDRGVAVGSDGVSPDFGRPVMWTADGREVFLASRGIYGDAYSIDDRGDIAGEREVRSPKGSLGRFEDWIDAKWPQGYEKPFPRGWQIVLWRRGSAK